MLIIRIYLLDDISVGMDREEIEFGYILFFMLYISTSENSTPYAHEDIDFSDHKHSQDSQRGVSNSNI